MTSTFPLTSSRRLVLLIGVPIVAVVVAWGAFSTVGLLGQASYPIGRSIPWNGGAISVAIDSGDLTVTPSPDNSIHVSGVVDYSLVKPALTVSTSGSSVAIKASCQLVVVGRCSVRISVEVPASAGVSASSASGDVTATNLGNVTLKSDSGDVRATSVSGVTTLQTELRRHHSDRIDVLGRDGERRLRHHIARLHRCPPARHRAGQLWRRHSLASPR